MNKLTRDFILTKSDHYLGSGHVLHTRDPSLPRYIN